MVKIIKLKKEFYDSVKNKSKVATTRKSDKGLCVGDTAVLVFTDDGSVDEKLTTESTILSIEKLLFSNITIAMAESEGYSSIESFKNSLKRFYPDLNDNSEVVYIKFKIQSE